MSKPPSVSRSVDPQPAAAPPVPAEVEAFIARWSPSSGAERANYQLFLAELCDLLGVPRPDPSVADDAANTYVLVLPAFQWQVSCGLRSSLPQKNRMRVR
jgi:hypothetical protein